MKSISEPVFQPTETVIQGDHHQITPAGQIWTVETLLLDGGTEKQRSAMYEDEHGTQLFVVRRIRSIEEHRTPDVQLQAILGIFDARTVLIRTAVVDLRI